MAYTNGLIKTKSKQYDEAISSYLKSIIKSDELRDLILYEFEDINDLNDIFFNNIDLLQRVVASAPENNRDNLLGDPMVSYITKTENLDIWKSNYNKTKSWTSFGNSDIAVVLTEDPESYNNNYTIKGVRVDADKLIQSSFDALAQSISVLTSSHGISVPNDTTNNYFAPTVSPINTKITRRRECFKGKAKST